MQIRILASERNQFSQRQHCTYSSSKIKLESGFMDSLLHNSNRTGTIIHYIVAYTAHYSPAKIQKEEKIINQKSPKRKHFQSKEVSIIIRWSHGAWCQLYGHLIQIAGKTLAQCFKKVLRKKFNSKRKIINWKKVWVGVFSWPHKVTYRKFSNREHLKSQMTPNGNKQ